MAKQKYLAESNQKHRGQQEKSQVFHSNVLCFRGIDNNGQQYLKDKGQVLNSFYHHLGKVINQDKSNDREPKSKLKSQQYNWIRERNSTLDLTCADQRFTDFAINWHTDITALILIAGFLHDYNVVSVNLTVQPKEHIIEDVGVQFNLVSSTLGHEATHTLSFYK